MQKTVRFVFISVLVVFLTSLSLLRAKEPPVKVAATIGMIADVVRHVAGEHAEVTGIIGTGVDPHLYKPTRGDVLTFHQAELIFYNGLMLEGKMGDVLVRMARTGKVVYPVTEEILAMENYVMNTREETLDPHVWMDVRGWMGAVEVVVKGLSEVRPAQAELFRKNADAYLETLGELDAYAKRVLSTVPENQRVLVTAHDAFGYFGRAYGLEVRGIQGLSTESEAGVRDIESLVAYLVDRDIPAVFVESSVADKNVRAVVEGARARGHQVRIGGELFSDAMGPGGTYEGTYVGMIDHNVTTIARALGGEAPEKGMRGRLGHSSLGTSY